MLILGMICAFSYAFTGGGAIIGMIECQREKNVKPWIAYDNMHVPKDCTPDRLGKGSSRTNRLHSRW